MQSKVSRKQNGETFDCIHERHVGLTAFQKRDELFAQCLVVIYRLAFPFDGFFQFFLHEASCSPKGAAAAPSLEPSMDSPVPAVRVHKLYTRMVSKRSFCGKSIAHKLSGWHTFLSPQRPRGNR